MVCPPTGNGHWNFMFPLFLDNCAAHIQSLFFLAEKLLKKNNFITFHYIIPHFLLFTVLPLKKKICISKIPPSSPILNNSLNRCGMNTEFQFINYWSSEHFRSLRLIAIIPAMKEMMIPNLLQSSSTTKNLWYQLYCNHLLQ